MWRELNEISEEEKKGAEGNKCESESKQEVEKERSESMEMSLNRVGLAEKVHGPVPQRDLWSCQGPPSKGCQGTVDMTKKKGTSDTESVENQGREVKNRASNEDPSRSSGWDGSHEAQRRADHQDADAGASLRPNAQAERPVGAIAAENWGPGEADTKGATRTDRTSTKRTDVRQQHHTKGIRRHEAPQAKDQGESESTTNFHPNAQA